MKRRQLMGERSRHRRTWHAARGIITLTIAFALMVAPLVVILTHGPAAHATAASLTAEIAAHGHAHDDAEHDRHGGLFEGHNPADHDHPLHALICQATAAPKPIPDQARCMLSDVFRDLALEGPRRPPRAV